MSEQQPSAALGTWVRVEEKGTDEQETYHIVESAEAELLENKIPVGSPLAQALIGKQPGDEVAIAGPNGKVNFSVLEVGKN